MGCLKVILRHLVGLLAFSNWLVGTTIIAACLWTIATGSNFNQLIDGKLPVTYFALGFGGLFFLNGILGWSGASKKSKLLLKLFLVLSFLIMLAELGLILTVAIFKANSHQLIDQAWSELNHKSHFLLQEQLVCCGLSGPTDYDSSRDIDQSCYHRDPLLPSNIEQPGNLLIREEPLGVGGLSNRLQANKSINTIGCRQKISDWLFESRLLILAFCGSLLLYQILTMLLTSAAISLSRRSRRHDDSMEELDASSEHHLHHHHHPGATYM